MWCKNHKKFKNTVFGGIVDAVAFKSYSSHEVRVQVSQTAIIHN